MDNRFFENPILNSPYAYPARHWELDADGQPEIKELLSVIMAGGAETFRLRRERCGY